MGERERLMRLETYKCEIEQYCLENGLSADKVFSSLYAHNNEQALLYYAPPPKEVVDGWEDIPLPTTLEIYLESDGSLRFEQTEITRKYLGNEVCVEESAGVAARVAATA